MHSIRKDILKYKKICICMVQIEQIEKLIRAHRIYFKYKIYFEVRFWTVRVELESDVMIAACQGPNVFLVSLLLRKPNCM